MAPDDQPSEPGRLENRYELLVQSVTDYAIFMLDTEGRVASWNAGAQRFKGYQAEEILGHHFSRFYTEEERAAGVPWRALETARSEGRFEAEGWRVRKDGTRFWASVVIDPVRDTSGELVGFAKVTRDLTERRETQRQLEETREAFFHSQKMDAIGKLTGGVAHDFNNLLAAVIGSLDLARRRIAQGGDATRFIDNAMKAAERGATLTQRMLAFARKQELTLETVDPADLLRGVVDLFQRTLGAAVAVELDVPEHLPAIHVDVGQLELTLLNLAVNARDAMPKGGRITISARHAEAPEGLAAGNYLRLSVADEGEGMDADTLARATEPFFTTKGVGRGTGLGLSMAHGFAEQSGGRLLLDSAPGRGTTVELWLPIAAEGQACTPREPEDAPAPPARPLTILAVDDDPLVLTNTSALLEELGHRVVTAASADEALALLGKDHIDLILTDYAMPGMTGSELSTAVRAAASDLPVILVSGYAELPPDGAAGVIKLGKPFRTDQLARAIAEAVDRGVEPAIDSMTLMRPRRRSSRRRTTRL